MQTIRLYLNGFNDKKELHHYIKGALDLPPYYGRNLDALFSELISLTETTSFVIAYTPESTLFSAYVQRALRVFRDAAGENPRLSVRIYDPNEAGYGIEE